MKTGLHQLVSTPSLQRAIKGNLGLLCHEASILPDYSFAVGHLKNIFGPRLTKLFGPQHGLVTDKQDNMKETQDFLHPYYKLPVHSLYGAYRHPTDEMLRGLNHLIVDLQDVGIRVYTYIWTLSLILERAHGLDLEVIVLDRPNPLGGEVVEGPPLEKDFSSFVGRDELPYRHGLTMGEFGQWFIKKRGLDVSYRVIPLEGQDRSSLWRETSLPWVPPSPNLPTAESALTYGAVVMAEGTNLSEGRGTTTPLQVWGHPKIEPHSFIQKLLSHPEWKQFEGTTLRPTHFLPTFQKHAGTPCGGVFLHLTDPKKVKLWPLGLWLLKRFKEELGEDFQWATGPYEYDHHHLPIDLICGSQAPRQWVEGLKTAPRPW